jgi:hypothetical protein
MQDLLLHRKAKENKLGTGEFIAKCTGMSMYLQLLLSPSLVAGQRSKLRFCQR